MQCPESPSINLYPAVMLDEKLKDLGNYQTPNDSQCKNKTHSTVYCVFCCLMQ